MTYLYEIISTGETIEVEIRALKKLRKALEEMGLTREDLI